MIAHLRGELARVSSDYAVVDVNGVGYKVYLPVKVLSSLPAEGDKVGLLVTTIVKEDSITLYGFSLEVQQELFELLLTVSGVGPKVALAILGELEPGDIISAISAEDYASLTVVSGLGKKTAQRIVLELREKLSEDMKLGAVKSKSLSGPVSDAMEALVGLGYRRDDVKRVCDEIVSASAGIPAAEEIIRRALGMLAKE
ncbi:MAG: Holliday junction branch migration protein RuvA [Abditibacteriota bacterium]|nr:Holliday junction branch migration protein RuvA [Abditibacteriota bacterium]